MKALYVLCCVALVAGCASVGLKDGERPEDARAMIGTPIAKVLEQSKGLRVEIYADSGKRVPSIPAGERGSVSVFTADNRSQDNYTFEKDGLISKHLRSSGDDFLKGVWTQVAE